MLCFLYATLCFICCYLLRCCTCRELCLPALFSSSAFCFVLLYPFHHGSVPAAASVVMQSHGFFVAPCLLQLFGYALQMSQQSIDRVRRVRASRERRATNVLLRPFAMDIQSTVGTSSEPLRVDRSKRPRSLMDFSAGLSKLHRQHRCLLRSKLPPLPPPHSPSGMVESYFHRHVILLLYPRRLRHGYDLPVLQLLLAGQALPHQQQIGNTSSRSRVRILR